MIPFNINIVLLYLSAVMYFSGVTGSGLSIMSRYPFETFMFHQWSLNGYIHKIFHGDWFGGKGIGLCRITVQALNINVYTTHVRITIKQIFCFKWSQIIMVLCFA